MEPDPKAVIGHFPLKKKKLKLTIEKPPTGRVYLAYACLATVMNREYSAKSTLQHPFCAMAM